LKAKKIEEDAGNFGKYNGKTKLQTRPKATTSKPIAERLTQKTAILKGNLNPIVSQTKTKNMEDDNYYYYQAKEDGKILSLRNSPNQTRSTILKSAR